MLKSKEKFLDKPILPCKQCCSKVVSLTASSINSRENNREKLKIGPF